MADEAGLVPTTWCVLIFALLLAALPALAQETTVTDDDVNAVAKQLYCPVCENIPLDTCGTPACIQWRQEIRAQLEAGRGPDEVVQDFVARFGDRVVGTPVDPTLRALSLMTPWLLAAVALVVAGLTLWRWRRGSAATSMPTDAPDTAGTDVDAYRARLEDDLRARR